MDQIAILQDLREEETILEVVESTTVSRVHVLQLGESGADAAGGVDCDEAIPGPVPVCLVARGSVGVVETLDDFRAEDVRPVRDVEACFFVEGLFIRGRAWVGGIIGGSGVGHPSEHLGADTRQSIGVGILAACNEGNTKVDIFLLFENETSEDEVPSVETRNYFEINTTNTI